MKRLVISLTSLLFCAALFSQTINDSNAESREVRKFHSIKVDHAIDVYLTQSEKESVVVSAGDRQFVDQVKTEIKDGVLHVWHDGGDIHHMNTHKMKLKVYISFVELDDIELGAGCHAYAVGEWKDTGLMKKLLKTMR
jgi:hypothetical protein